MDKKDLEKLIAEKTKKEKKEQKKRVLKVIAVYTAVYFFLFCLFGGTPVDFNDFFSCLLSSFLISWLNFGIYESVFEHLFAKDEAARNEIEELKRQK